ncbi:hypothetical protein C2869_04540 [Saccharobesus litoralis]|uniref:Uncharacterized protein n=1 Tax=Saccharobesus litoralis TaxID=2172099 RepID=A0A2S0VNI9_9ALTE|nr:hypothetical protein [Saccharobesus litoralis]AWB65749.1 hypothetical protein C2869_04540 [Saccharobesus litoralis]
MRVYIWFYLVLAMALSGLLLLKPLPVRADSPNSASASQPIIINVGISKETADVYNAWLDGGHCTDVDDFSTAYSPRGAAELLIFCKALHAAGLPFELNLLMSGNYARSLLLASSEYLHTTGETIWLKQADKKRFYVSSAIIEDGALEKGIFTRKDHPLQSVAPENVAEQLRSYVGITVNNWIYDWRVLKQVTPLLMSAPSQSSIHKMINVKRADFCFGEFNQAMQFELENIPLAIVSGVKVRLSGSRHFVINKSMPNSQQIYSALNKGLEQLRAVGAIKNILQNSGVHHRDTEDWLVINP